MKQRETSTGLRGERQRASNIHTDIGTREVALEVGRVMKEDDAERGLRLELETGRPY